MSIEEWFALRLMYAESRVCWSMAWEDLRLAVQDDSMAWWMPRWMWLAGSKVVATLPSVRR